MKTDHLLDDIREVNLTYLMLAQNMIRRDKAEGMYRLGVSDEVAAILEQLSAGQILKIASSSTLICNFRFGDEMVWNLLTSHGKERGVSGVHAAILMAAQAAEVA